MRRVKEGDKNLFVVRGMSKLSQSGEGEAAGLPKDVAVGKSKKLKSSKKGRKEAGPEGAKVKKSKGRSEAMNVDTEEAGSSKKHRSKPSKCDSGEAEAASSSADASRSKKRNKSRGAPSTPSSSEEEEVAEKKAKTDVGTRKRTKDKMSRNRKHKKMRKEREERAGDTGPSGLDGATDLEKSDAMEVVEELVKPKKAKKNKKEKKMDVDSLSMDQGVKEKDNEEGKKKKRKQKKRAAKSSSEEVPKKKVRKTSDTSEEEITEDLGKLNFGENPHTLSNMLEDMTVIDKKKKFRELKKMISAAAASNDPDAARAEIDNKFDLEKTVLWTKKRWNKDRKGVGALTRLNSSVVVENLPLNIMCMYKTMLTDHFSACGPIKRIGIAEVYSAEDFKPVFSTTIHFESEYAAVKALEEDNTVYQGQRICVKRPLPPTDTTVVLRSYADLTEQAVSSMFASVGKIRSLRILAKRKKNMMVAFVEFDGPQTVAKALGVAEGVTIGGKKFYASKYEIRGTRGTKNEPSDTDN